MPGIRRSWAALLYVAALAALLPIARPGTAADAAAPDPLTQRGWQLRAEIDATYQQLRASKTLTHRVDQTNDVTAVVVKYLPAGTSFDEAAAILSAAGCRIGVDAQGHGYATLPMRDGLLQVKHTLAVSLIPRSPNDYSIVGEVSGMIYEQYRVKYDLK